MLRAQLVTQSSNGGSGLFYILNQEINILISGLKLRFLFRLLATPATKSYSVQERAYVIEVIIFIYLSSKLDVMTF